MSQCEVTTYFASKTIAMRPAARGAAENSCSIISTPNSCLLYKQNVITPALCFGSTILRERHAVEDTLVY